MFLYFLKSSYSLVWFYIVIVSVSFYKFNVSVTKSCKITIQFIYNRYHFIFNYIKL